MPLLASLPRTTRTVAPQGPTRINWGEPLTRGLVFAAPLAGAIRAPDLVSGLIPAVPTPVMAQSPIGVAAKVGNTTTNVLTYPNRAPVSTAATYTISAWVCVIAAPSASSYGYVVQYNNTNLTDHFLLQSSSSNAVRLIAFNTAGGSIIAQGGGAPVVGKSYFLVGTFDTSALARVYLNGVLINTSTALTGTPQNASTGSLVVGNTQDNQELINAYINNVAIWNRALNQGEIQRLYANRWALYEPTGPQRFILALSAGGTPATVAISPIALSLTPQSVAASGAAAVGVSPISFTLTPQNILATGAANVAINPIPFTLTPQSAAGSGAASVGVTPIAFNLAPQAVAATGAASAAVTPITLNLAPQTVTATGAATVGVSPIALTLTVQSVAASVAVTTLPLHGAALDVATWHSAVADYPGFHAGGLDAGTFHANPEETP